MLVKITPTATMTVTTMTKAVIVGKAVITDGPLRRINVHFNFAVSGRAPIGLHHEALLEKPIELEIPRRVKRSHPLSKVCIKVPTPPAPKRRPVRLS